MKLLTSLFRKARKSLMTTDNDMGQFRAKIDELIAGKDGLSDEEVVAKVDELKGFAADLPDSEDKAELDRYLEDFKSIKGLDEAVAKKAAEMVADLFEKLDTEAMKEVPAVEEEAEPAAEPEAAPTEEVSTETEEIAEETEAPAETEEAEDADPTISEYTAEEIYQYVKKRMKEDAEAEDAACEDDADEVEEVQEEEEKEDEVVEDHAPTIPVTMNQKPAEHGSLRELLEKF